MRFCGNSVALRGAKAPWHGVAAVSVDGGPEQLVDYYSSGRQDDVSLLTLSGLTAGDHGLRVRVTGTKNSASNGFVVTVDRIDVGMGATTTTTVATATSLPPATTTSAPAPATSTTAPWTPKCRGKCKKR